MSCVADHRNLNFSPLQAGLINTVDCMNVNILFYSTAQNKEALPPQV